MLRSRSRGAAPAVLAGLSALALAGSTALAGSASAATPVADPAGILNLPTGLSYQVLATGGQTDVVATETNTPWKMPEDFDANIVVPARGGGGSWLVTAHELTKPVTGDYQGDAGKSAVPEQATTDDGDSDGWGSVTRMRLGTNGLPVPGAVPQVITTGLHNLCAGQKTPWKTFLVNEEFPFRVDPQNRSGWVWEVNPYTGKATKLTGMGRLSHEQEVRVGKSWYLTDDNGGPSFLYKFVPTRASHLTTGKLYGLAFDRSTGRGTWVGPLDPMDPRAAMAAKGYNPATSGFDKAEGLAKRGNQVVMSESGSGSSAGRVWSFRKAREGVRGTVLLEGDFAKMSHPDNLRFTGAGDLLVLEDNGSALATTANGGMNEIYVLPKHRSGQDNLSLVSTVPNGGEPTGPAFSRNGKLLYLSIQGDPSYTVAISGHDWDTRFRG